MPQEIAATWSRSGSPSQHLARLHPGDAVVQRDPGAGDRGGAGAAVGLDHVAVDRDLPLAERLRDRPPRAGCGRSGAGSRRCGRPACRRRPRAGCAPSVARGSMPYSAVTQPRAWPLSQGGSRSSSVAVTSTWVSPNFTKQEPSAYFTTPRSSETARSSSGCRRLGRIGRSPSAGRDCRPGTAFRSFRAKWIPICRRTRHNARADQVRAPSERHPA